MACSTLARSRCTFGTARPAVPVQRLRMVVRAQAQQQNVKEQLAQLVKPASVATIANFIMAMPASAEAGKIFDFNLTLPIMATEFLLLMVFLDKFWFSPVGKVLDERDATIRDKLGAVKDNSGDLDKLISEAENILKAARAEVSALVNSKKNAKQSELDASYNAAKAKITAETDSAVAGLEKESQAMLQKLDAQVDKISAEVLRRVLPEGVRI